MTRSLPKTVPLAVMNAARNTVRKADDGTVERRKAHNSYMAIRMQPRSNAQVIAFRYLELEAKAQSIVEWGVMLRRQLPTVELDRRFRTRGGSSMGLSVVRQEIEFRPQGEFPGGRLGTELELLLDHDDDLFRHYERIDGYLVNGGGVLNSASALRMALQPETLERLHHHIAEGVAWPHIERSLAALLESRKDG